MRFPTVLLVGGPFSGKTYSSLLIARGIARAWGRKILIVDSRDDVRAAVEAIPDWEPSLVAETIVLGSRSTLHSPSEYQKILTNVAETRGSQVGVVIIDTISEMWSSVGGILDQVEMARASGERGGWRTALQLLHSFFTKLRSLPFFVICTAQAKVQVVWSPEYDKINHILVSPVQKENVESEFDVVGYLSNTHVATFCSRIGRLHKETCLPDESVGRRIYDWWRSVHAKMGAPGEVPSSASRPSRPATTEEGAAQQPVFRGSPTAPRPLTEASRGRFPSRQTTSSEKSGEF